ncbi:MAG: urease accessory UreF family protein [Hyphomicrobiales bacterium]|nr:urease accessory UreF family protein [Hyphomicrobiales bacterium]
MAHDAIQRSLLQIWFSPAFPVGGFAYSHGLEFAVEAGAVHDRETLQGWIASLLVHGSAQADAAVIAAAWQAMRGERAQTVADVAEFSAALQPSAERYFEATTLGRAFMDAVLASWPMPELAAVAAIDALTYPAAVGIAAAAHKIDLTLTLEAYTLAFVSSQTSAAIRLGVIGQTDGQRIIAALLPDIHAVAAAPCDLDQIGACTFAADLASILHESQYSRLFRS